MWRRFTLALGALVLSTAPLQAQQKNKNSQDTIQTIRGKSKKMSTPATRTVRSVRPSPRPALRRAAAPKPEAVKRVQKIVVAQSGNGQFRTIGEAVKAAQAGAQVLVRGGTYRETVVIDKPVEVGPASPEDLVVLEGTSHPALFLEAPMSSGSTPRAMVRDVTIQIAGPAEAWANTAVDVSQGDPLIVRCEVIGGKNACIAVHGKNSNPFIRHCTVHRGANEGVQFADHSRGVMEDSEVYSCGVNGIDIVGGASPKVLRTKVHDNRRAGILLDYAGKVGLGQIDAFKNEWVGIAVRHLSTANLRFCRAYSNGLMGLWIVETSVVTAESCDANDNGASGIEAIGVVGTLIKSCNTFANKDHGIHIWDAKVSVDTCDSYGNLRDGIFLQGETPIARTTKVHENKGRGLRISDGCLANVEECDVWGNTGIGVLVDTGAKPIIRSCKLHDNKIDGATVVDAATAGVFEDCDVYGNAESGIGILGGSPAVRLCRISNNKNGLVVGSIGRSTAEDCEANDNLNYGIASIPGGSLSALRCTARGNKSSGIFVDSNAFGSFDRCEVYDNGRPNVTVRDKGKANFLACRIPGG